MCSGNPWCDFEAKLSPTHACPGWQSCSSTDNRPYSVVTPTKTPTPTSTITPTPLNGTLWGYVYRNNCDYYSCNVCGYNNDPYITVKSGSTVKATCQTYTNPVNNHPGYYECSLPEGAYTATVCTNVGETCLTFARLV
jgi:hypothetical protein